MTVLRLRCLVLATTLAAAPAAPAGPASAQERRPPVRELYRELTFRSIGPAVTGGRVHDVEALPFDPATIYLAAASGGIWKSTDKGTTWRSVFDHEATSTFGDLAISRSHPHILYAGTGEQNNRQSSSWGSGVYRSDDGGESWRHLGLTDTRHVGRVRVHPADPDIAWVAAQGNLWKPTEDRGVYRTTDGGRSWERTLFVDTLTGATDLAVDACDPDLLYAATYQRLRRTWGFNGGGPGSGIWRSRDGGRTWERLSAGLPAGDMGRIGLAAAGNRCGTANAVIEHANQPGVYRTEDGGDTWAQMSGRNVRPMYYSHIFIDPTDADRVYSLATTSARSEDGGRTWTDISARKAYDVGVHSDHHSLWIDPLNPEHFYLAGDAGLYETWNRGDTYIRLNNVPIAQAYALGLDAREPYNVYLGLQDNHSWMGPSANRRWAGIIGDDWRQIGFGDGMYHQTDPSDPRIVYGNSQNGGYFRVDTETGDRLHVAPVEPADEAEEYRWDWVSPSLVSPHDPATLYVGANRLFISRDRGESWERTADLTRQIDRDTLRLMGTLGVDIALSPHDGADSYGEITTIAESPVQPGVLWVGTDDGSLQLSRDDGRTWTDVAGNVPGLPHGSYVSRVIGSTRSPGTAYATFDAHRDGDFDPYVYRTTDFGASWAPLVEGLRDAGSVNVVREHPGNPDLLFLGTEHALWVSTDAGARWEPLGSNLPTTLYDDLAVHPRTGDLVVATHGRGVWILDDASPLARLDEAAGRPAHLFPVRDATIHLYWKDTSYRGDLFWTGENPPGAIFSYRLAEPAANARIVVRRGADEIRSIPVSGEPGVIHRVAWDLRYPAAVEYAGEEDDTGLPHPVGARGPLVATGTYTVTLESGGVRSARTLLVRGDPAMPMLTDADYARREAFLLAVVALERRLRDDGPATTGSDSPDSERRRLLRRAVSLRREIMGSDVRQGTLYPPTIAQQRRLDRLRQDAQAWLPALEERPR
jgi:photosystem II stability/assembly factor-like uncharacterized protein